MPHLMQVAARATDLTESTRFWSELLGRPPAASFDPPGLVFFDLGGVRLLLEGAAPATTVYLQVADVAAEVARLRDAGLPIETEPHAIFTHEDDTLGPAGTEEWMAFVKDPAGNLVGLVEHRPVP